MYSLYSHLVCIDQDSWSSRVQHALPFYFQKAGPALQLLASPAFEVMLKPKSAIFAVPCLGLKKKHHRAHSGNMEYRKINWIYSGY